MGLVLPAAVVKAFTDEYLMKAFDDNDDLFITVYDNEHNKLLSKAQGLRSESFTKLINKVIIAIKVTGTGQQAFFVVC